MRFIFYITGIFISLALMVIFTNYEVRINQNVLFFELFGISLISAIFGFIIFRAKYKDNFERFLVLFSYILINILFTYYIAVIIDRSLSAFMYFYSVENKSISTDIYDESYFKEYINRRYEEGKKIGYLICDYDKKECKPTIKTRLTYMVMYPIGKLTGTLGHYDDFKILMRNKNKTNQR